MKRRTVLPWLLGSIAAAACGGDHPAGPAALTCHASSATAVVLAVGGYIAIDPATDAGCITVAANASTIDSAEYLLVPQSASGSTSASSLFQLQAATLQPTAPFAGATAVAPAPPQRDVALAFDLFLRRAAASRRYGTAPVASAPVNPARAIGAVTPPALGSVRQFKVCGDLNCSIKTVGARVQKLGVHVAIYVDTLAPSNGLNSFDLDTIKTVFDSILYPIDTTAFGRETDVDANGVVIVLMTGVVNSLTPKAQCSTSGGTFIAGFFFPADLDPLFRAQYNNGEIFYSIVADSAGTLSCVHTRAEVKTSTPPTFTHEFQHMINFGQHVIVQNANAEEGWLDEGLSKYAEELGGRYYLQRADTVTFSRYAFQDVNAAYQYLSATGGSPLLIPVDQGTLAEIGASWLFVRYAVDQFGDTLPRKLVQSALTGAANVQAGTKDSFDIVVTRWALANWVSDLPGFTAPPELKYTSWHFRRTFGSLNSQDPRDFPLPYPLVPTASAGSAVNLSGTLFAGSGVFQRALQGPGGSAFTLSFSQNGTAALPAGVVPRLSVIRIR